MKKTVYCFLCLLLFLSCSKTEPVKTPVNVVPAGETGQNTAFTTEAPVKVSQKSLEHIISRHWSTSGAEGAGKFLPEITTGVLKEMIETTAVKGKIRPNTHGRPGKIAEYKFDKVIGTTIGGSPASRLRVVIAPDDYVITAFSD